MRFDVTTKQFPYNFFEFVGNTVQSASVRNIYTDLANGNIPYKKGSIKKIVSGLNDHQREVLTDRFEKQQTLREVADEHAVNAGSIQVVSKCIAERFMSHDIMELLICGDERIIPIESIVHAPLPISKFNLTDCTKNYLQSIGIETTEDIITKFVLCDYTKLDTVVRFEIMKLHNELDIRCLYGNVKAIKSCAPCTEDTKDLLDLGFRPRYITHLRNVGINTFGDLRNYLANHHVMAIHGIAEDSMKDILRITRTILGKY